MAKTTLSRVIKSGWQGFIRNSWLSLATVLVMAITIFLMTSLFLFNVVAHDVLKNLQDKVDISVYFTQSAPEEDILRVNQKLNLLEEVKDVDYISRERALIDFKKKHGDNAVLLRSLDELEENPLQASLNIKAQAASQYEAIVNFLESLKNQEMIDKINYRENKALILRVSALSNNIQKSGWIITAILAFIAVLVSFNTVRLTMYNWREEIKVMRLVGATNSFIRGPFLIEGVFYGFSAALISLAVIYPMVYFLSPKIMNFLGGINILEFFNLYFWLIFSAQIIIGVLLGLFSSAIAIRRHLRV